MPVQKARPAYALSPRSKPRANSKRVWKSNVMKLPASIARTSKPKWFVTPNKKETTND